eukprot:TRINITY_DN16344_c0_g7_i1.p1 TRINITY_DN16344_c0_g7~~TRINITY_DN16344_c0_g7_i1.p1  ORF type:complete len:229 (+),score=33.39 TRINITY_DN16344_c0_g7_i1:108-794(+)
MSARVVFQPLRSIRRDCRRLSRDARKGREKEREREDRHGDEFVDTVSEFATAGVLLTPAIGAAFHHAPTDALVFQAATEIIGPATTQILAGALISVSVTNFVYSEIVLRSRCCAPLVRAGEEFRQGIWVHWTATLRTYPTLLCQEYCQKKPSGASASSQDVAQTESSQTGKRKENKVSERRLDPLDGRLYTYQEIMSFYSFAFSAHQIKYYWESTCRPVTGRQTLASE